MTPDGLVSKVYRSGVFNIGMLEWEMDTSERLVAFFKNSDLQCVQASILIFFMAIQPVPIKDFEGKLQKIVA